jgi:hypothetical protein
MLAYHCKYKAPAYGQEGYTPIDEADSCVVVLGDYGPGLENFPAKPV